MPRIEFTRQLARHVECPPQTVEAATLGDAFECVFVENETLRGYVLNDFGAIRKHVAVFIDNELVHDRENLNIPLKADTEVYVMQALSGG